MSKFKCSIHVDQSCVREDGRKPHALYCDDPSLAQQSAAAECDINTIVRRGMQGIVPTHVNPLAPQYGDFSDIPDYQGAFAVVARANSLFEAMPWEAREKFGNDPSKMVSWLQDPKNADEAISLGLLVAKAPPLVTEPPLGDVSGLDESSTESSTGAKPKSKHSK